MFSYAIGLLKNRPPFLSEALVYGDATDYCCFVTVAFVSVFSAADTFALA
jgi:hypothetical protein